MNLWRIWSRRPRISWYSFIDWLEDWGDNYFDRLELEYQRWKPIYLHRQELIARGLPQEKKIPVKCEIHRKPKYSCDVCQWDNIIEGRGRQQRPIEGRARDRLDRIQRRAQVQTQNQEMVQAYRARLEADLASMAQQQRAMAAAMQQNVVQSFFAPNPTFTHLLVQAPQQQAEQQWSVPISFTTNQSWWTAPATPASPQAQTSSAPCRYCGYFGVHICADPSRPR